MLWIVMQQTQHLTKTFRAVDKINSNCQKLLLFKQTWKAILKLQIVKH